MAKKILLTVLILAITIMIVEVAGRWILPQDAIRLIGDIDHRMAPFSDKEINEDGIRFKGASTDVAGKTTAIFLGDSYTYGYRLRYKETIPQQFEALHNIHNINPIQTINFGWISSSPVLSERLLRDIGEKYHPQTVFLLLDMTDIWDDNLYSQLLSGNLMSFGGKYFPATTIALYQLLATFPKAYEKVLGQPIQRFFHAHQPMAKSKHLFQNTTTAINNIARYTEETLQANFVLVVLPRNFQYSDKEAPVSPDRHSDNLAYEDLGPYVEEPFRFFEEYRQQVNFPVILLLEDFKNSVVFPTTFDNDSHYNGAGAKLAAEALYRHCTELKCLSPAHIRQE